MDKIINLLNKMLTRQQNGNIMYQNVDKSTNEKKKGRVHCMLKRFEMFSNVISGINRYIQKIERDEMIKYGYKGAYAQYLVALYKYDEGMTMARLCEVCDKDKAAVSRVVTELIQKDLVVKKTQDNKTYKGKLFLTDEGKKAAGFVMEKARKAVYEVGGELSDGEREVLYKSLETIANNLKRISSEGFR